MLVHNKIGRCSSCFRLVPTVVMTLSNAACLTNFESVRLLLGAKPFERFRVSQEENNGKLSRHEFLSTPAADGRI
jgi:hypothetical protein